MFRNREVVAAAIRTKQPQLFAHRRPFAIDGGPSSLQDPSRPYDALLDVQLTNTRLTMGPRSVALWSFTLRNANPRVAFRDVLFSSARALPFSGAPTRTTQHSDPPFWKKP